MEVAFPEPPPDVDTVVDEVLQAGLTLPTPIMAQLEEGWELFRLPPLEVLTVNLSRLSDDGEANFEVSNWRVLLGLRREGSLDAQGLGHVDLDAGAVDDRVALRAVTVGPHADALLHAFEYVDTLPRIGEHPYDVRAVDIPALHYVGLHLQSPGGNELLVPATYDAPEPLRHTQFGPNVMAAVGRAWEISLQEDSS
jgi:hypothetical protein